LRHLRAPGSLHIKIRATRHAAGTVLATATAEEYDMNPAQMNDDASALDVRSAHDMKPSAGVQIETCSPLDHFVVTTRNSLYDVIVVCGAEGRVFVRGGRMFPEFRLAWLVGATDGGHTLRLRGIYPGLCMEFYADGRSVVTSPVLDVSPVPPPDPKGLHH
jgi:hypothetical protein